MSTVIAQEKNGKITHFIRCRMEERGDKMAILHDEENHVIGGVDTTIQKVFDKSELESIKQED